MSSEPKNFSQAIDDLERATRDRFHDLEEKILSLKPEIEKEFGKAKKQVEHQVQENPWVALGVAGLLFFILGFIFGDRSSRRRD